MESYLNENFGDVIPRHSSEEALQRWRNLRGDVKNPKRRFRFTANLSKRCEAAAMRRTNQKKLRAAVLVSQAAFQFIQGLNLSREEEYAAGFQICADEMESAGVTDRMVLNTGKSAMIEKKLRELIPETQTSLQYIWLVLMRIAILMTMVYGLVRRSGGLMFGKILFSFREVNLRKACLQYILLILMRIAILLVMVFGLVQRSGGRILMFGKILFSFRKVNLMMAPNWSQLPSDLISTVVDQFSTIEDFAASSQVNHHWHSVCSNMNWTQGPQPPWLMLSESPNSNWRSFFSLYNNVWYKLELPTVRGRQCYGTAQGWIIAVGPDFQSHCLHPLLKVKINLPVLSALQNQIGVLTDWFNIIQKFIAFKISDDQFLVMAIYGPSSRLAYVKPGDSEWVIFEGSHFKDVTFFQGHYYALCGRGTLIHCQLSDGSVDVVDYPPRDLKTADKMYLVESSGKLFAVFRYGFATVFDNWYKSESFLVYKYQFDVPDNPFDPNDVFDSDDPNELVPVDLDDDRFDPNDPPPPRWARVKDLEDGAFFVGNGNSWSVCAGNTVNCKRNHIYFTDDNWGQQRGSYGGHDIGAFDMESKEIECLNFGVDTPSVYSRPIWLTPTLR